MKQLRDEGFDLGFLLKVVDVMEHDALADDEVVVNVLVDLPQSMDR